MEHVITTYGGGDLFKLVFDGIAALFKNDATGVLMPLIRVGLSIGLLYVVILMLYRDQLIEGLKWFLWVVVATNLLFLPKTTVWIHDPLANTKNKVDNVPWALGAFAGFVSQVGTCVTQKMESVFSLPDYMPYHKTGTVFASALMSQVGKFRIVDPVFKGNMERFVNQCVVYDSMIGHKYTLTDLQNTPDIWTLVLNNASPVLGFLYKDGKQPGAVVTCKVGAQKLATLWASEIKLATQLYGTRVQDRSLSEKALLDGILGSAKLLSDSKALANNASTILRQEMMINAIEEASNNKLSELGIAGNYAATKALLQQRSAYAIAGEIAARTLPLFKNVIEALSYVLFIFIVGLALLPNGYRVLTTYFGILLWTQLWAPLYAVLNLVMSLYGQKESLAHGLGKGLTLLNSSAIVNANADMTTLAAWLSVSIPFISYGILKQGAGAFVGLAQHLGSAMQAASSGAAAETVSGNISLGNISMGTQAYQNTSAFQHNTSPSYNASQFNAMGIDGTERTTHGDGSKTFTDHGISQGAVEETALFNESVEMQQRLSHAESVANSKSIAAGKQMESAHQQTANVLNQVGSDLFANENYSKSLTASESKAVQEVKSLANELSKNTSLTEGQALEVAAYAKAGIGILGSEVGLSGNFSSTAARQEALNKANSMSHSTNSTESAEKLLSAAKSVAEGQNNTKGASLAENAMASFNEAHQLREEASLAHSKVDELSNSLASSQSSGTQERRNIGQNILDYIADQPAPSSPVLDSSDGQGSPGGGKIGAERAWTIQRRGGDEYLSYKARFMAENPQYSVARVDTAKEQANLTTQFENGAAKLVAESSLRDHYSHNNKAVHNKGHEGGLDLSGPPPSANAEVSNSMNWKSGERPLENMLNSQKKEEENNAATKLESKEASHAHHSQSTQPIHNEGQKEFNLPMGLELNSQDGGLALSGLAPSANRDGGTSVDEKLGERSSQNISPSTKEKGDNSASVEATSSPPPSPTTPQSPHNSLREEIGGNMTQVDKTFEKSLKKINDEGKTLNDAFEVSENQTLFGKSLQGADKSLKRGIGIDDEEVIKRVKEKVAPHLTPPEKMKP